MWCSGAHHNAAQVAAKLGHVAIAAQKAEFSKQCRDVLAMFQPGAKVRLDDGDGLTLRAALQWAAIEHEKAAKDLAGKDAAESAKRAGFAGECARVADRFATRH
jgi:hypothetical protein